MRTPNNELDIIGSAMQLGSGIVSLVQEFAPDRKQRKINVAIRRLKHRFKNVPVESYVKVNFSEYIEEGKQEITTFIKQALGK